MFSSTLKVCRPLFEKSCYFLYMLQIKSYYEEDDAEWTTQPLRRHSVGEAPPIMGSGGTPGRPVKSKSLPTPPVTPHKPNKKPIMVLATRKRTVSTEQMTQKVTTSPQPLHVQGESHYVLCLNMKYTVLFQAGETLYDLRLKNVLTYETTVPINPFICFGVDKSTSQYVLQT